MTCTGFNREAVFQAQLQHLVRMAKLPGWKAYAWRRAQELSADQSGLFAGMDAALQAAMTGPAEASGCAAPGSTKRP